VPQSDKEALKWNQKAADQGFVDYQADNLGFVYSTGEGVPWIVPFLD
jgi:TPR repeat protein